MRIRGRIRDRARASLLGAVESALAVPAVSDLVCHRFATHYFQWCKARLFLNLQRPTLFVQWLVTFRCNFRCKHCEADAGCREVDELTTAEAMDLVDQLAEMKVPRLLISGGEPLVREDLFDIIGYAVKRGLSYGIVTNGYRVEDFGQQFAVARPYTYFTSIDGLEQSNDEWRGQPGAFRRALSALDFFRRLGVKRRLVNTVVHPGNLDELPGLKEILRRSGATVWRLALTIPVGRARDQEQLFLDDAQIEQVFRFIESSRREMDVRISEDAGYLGCRDLALRKTPFFCAAGLSRCSVMPDGEVLGCQIVYDNRFSEGNIRERSFQSIWQHGFRRFRQPEFDEECSQCEHLLSCRGGCWGMRQGNRHCLKRIWAPEAS